MPCGGPLGHLTALVAVVSPCSCSLLLLSFSRHLPSVTRSLTDLSVTSIFARDATVGRRIFLLYDEDLASSHDSTFALFSALVQDVQWCMMPWLSRWLARRAICVPTRKHSGAEVKISRGVKLSHERWEVCNLHEEPMGSGTVTKIVDSCRHPDTMAGEEC
jgi:hypothetical protein